MGTASKGWSGAKEEGKERVCRIRLISIVDLRVLNAYRKDDAQKTNKKLVRSMRDTMSNNGELKNVKVQRNLSARRFERTNVFEKVKAVREAIRKVGS